MLETPLRMFWAHFAKTPVCNVDSTIALAMARLKDAMVVDHSFNTRTKGRDLASKLADASTRPPNPSFIAKYFSVYLDPLSSRPFTHTPIFPHTPFRHHLMPPVLSRPARPR